MLDFLFRLIYPPKCIFCGCLLPVGSTYEACQCCIRDVKVVSGSVGVSYEETPCLDGILCVCSYSGKLKKAVTKYKYYNKPSYHRFFAGIMAESLIKALNSHPVDLILSVPLYSERLRSRGYNQSFLLSGFISRRLGIPEKSGILKRIKDTGYQSHLSRNERIANVEGAFAVQKGADIKGKKILLIDDIFTTGSTLNQCAHALKEAGAAKVYAAALASTKQL